MSQNDPMHRSISDPSLLHKNMNLYFNQFLTYENGPFLVISRDFFLAETTIPKDPAVLKTLRDSELLRRSVFTTPPRLLRREPFFERKHVCKSQENSVRTRCAAIVNQYAIVNLLRWVILIRRSIFSTVGSFGIL